MKKTLPGIRTWVAALATLGLTAVSATAGDGNVGVARISDHGRTQTSHSGPVIRAQSLDGWSASGIVPTGASCGDTCGDKSCGESCTPTCDAPAGKSCGEGCGDAGCGENCKSAACNPRRVAAEERRFERRVGRAYRAQDRKYGIQRGADGGWHSGGGYGGDCNDAGYGRGYQSRMGRLMGQARTSRAGRAWNGQRSSYFANNRALSNKLFGWLIPAGHGGQGSPLIGKYHINYAQNPHHFDPRDGGMYAAQGYGTHVTVPLAPNVRHQYNYGWGMPSSRITHVSNIAPYTRPRSLHW